MGVHLARNVSHVVRRLQRHMAIGALLRFRRIVERPRTLAGDSACLPVVVLIEAANPSVMIHWRIEMNFMAGGTELRRLLLHEWL